MIHKKKKRGVGEKRAASSEQFIDSPKYLSDSNPESLSRPQMTK